MWTHIQAQILGALTTAQITLIGYFGLNLELITAALIPLPFITSIFAWVAVKRFGKTFDCAPMQVVSKEVRNLFAWDSGLPIKT